MAIQCGIGQMPVFNLAIRQECVGPLFRLVQRAPPKDFDKRRILRDGIGRTWFHAIPDDVVLVQVRFSRLR